MTQMMMRFLLAFIPAALMMAAIGCQAPEQEPPPTATPYPTQVPLSTHTPFPTWTPAPTATPYPTHIPLATYTPHPTLTPYPTATLYPTYTPYPTATHRPTYTPRPTSTRVPTPTPRPPFPAARTFTIQELDTRTSKVWKDKQPFLLVGCLAKDEADSVHGENWYTLSFDGRFSEGRYFANVSGFGMIRVGRVVKGPKAGDCYEMVVKYEDSDSYCYWIETGIVPRVQIPGYCNGWQQQTPFFHLVNDSAAVPISKAEWRSKYGNRG